MTTRNETDAPFSFTRRNDEEENLRSADLGEIVESENIGEESWLFFCPHDDDGVIGGGLWMQAAIEAGVKVQVAITTDGRMGYCSPEQRDTIVSIRKGETLRAYEILGVQEEHIHFLGFHDCALGNVTGRRPAGPSENDICGHTGLQNAYTFLLRMIRPNRIFVPSPADLHPDHKLTHQELLISLFHASGEIWPELGPPQGVPEVYETAVYCDFVEPPNLELRTSSDIFEKKLEAIATYKSQIQIKALVDNIRSSGAVEYLRHVNFRFYSPELYEDLFR